jgi:hypothetical protein
MVVSRAMYAIVSATAWHEPRVSAKAATTRLWAFKASDLKGFGYCDYADLMTSCFTCVIAIRMFAMLSLWSRRPYASKKAAR